uniref:hypothetical protein n=1 Tax=uncultured Empedobacter sp. TaxID=410844 RepID=UPI0026119F2D
FYSLLIYFNYRYSYALRGKEQKSNQKTLVFDFQRTKLVSVIQCFKSLTFFHFLLIQKTFEIKRRSHGMAQVIQLTKLFS